MMLKKSPVLIFPAGSEIGLEIYHSLKYSHHVEVFGASGKNDHASFVYDHEHYVEDALYVDRADFIARFNRLLTALEIEYVYPTHDTIACFLAQHQAELKARVLTSPFETNRIARHKLETYRLFREFDFCPKLFQTDDVLSYPVFLKPDDGQGGKGTFIAHDESELQFYLGKHPGLLISEYLPGDELSVDCFTDFSGRLRFIGPRTRERIQMGISFRSTVAELTDEINRIAHAINDAVKLDGAWFFQVKQDGRGKFKLLEFAPRQSSTMGLYRHAGVNFALLSLFNAQGKPVEIAPNTYPLQLDRCLHNRFKAGFDYRRVYIDFDETLVIGHHVHPLAMAFLYQCRNRGIELILLTKHRYCLAETLQQCGIAESLFSRIVQLSEEADKADHIEADGAIFIDNYWFDRRAVRQRHGIPVFDVDAIDCLLQ